jgi:hypothetical protein
LEGTPPLAVAKAEEDVEFIASRFLLREDSGASIAEFERLRLDFLPLTVGSAAALSFFSAEEDKAFGVRCLIWSLSSLCVSKSFLFAKDSMHLDPLGNSKVQRNMDAAFSGTGTFW